MYTKSWFTLTVINTIALLQLMYERNWNTQLPPNKNLALNQTAKICKLILISLIKENQIIISAAFSGDRDIKIDHSIFLNILKQVFFALC